jgi:steroid delta-isomerase-like uncharacterized protein
MNDEQLALAEQSAQTEAWALNYLKNVDIKDSRLMDSLIAEDAEYHDIRYEPIIGKAELRKWGAGLWSGVPDLDRVRIKNIAARGRICFVECDFEGTHVGEYLGFPATGNRIKYSAVQILTFNEQGQLCRQMFYNDVQALEDQLRTPAGEK